MLRTRKRIGAALLAAGLVFSQLGATAYAVESPAGTGCVNTTLPMTPPYAVMWRPYRAATANTNTRRSATRTS